MVSSGESDATLDESEVFHILGNDRRREIINRVAGRPNVMVSELAEEIAEREEESEQASENLYKSVYVSLQQTHLPKLAKEDIIEYDQESNTVKPGPRLEEVQVYVGEDGPWIRAARVAPLVVSLVGLAVVLASMYGLVIISALSPQIWAIVFLLLIAGISAIRTVQER